MVGRWLVRAAFGAAALALIAACNESGSYGNRSDGTPAAGCALPATAQPAPDGNLLANPGFEAGGGAPWYAKDGWGTTFAVSDAQARSGERSAYLRLRSADPPPGETVRVYGVVQDLCPETFPAVVRGHYYVARWKQGTPHQYLQVVAIVLNAENMPEEAAPATNHQVRYILAGAATQPTRIRNARYVMVSTAPPKVGAWVPFELRLRDDFRDLWGEVPRGYYNLAVFFEVRWDNRQPTDGVSVADVYYDDLYLGPEG